MTCGDGLGRKSNCNIDLLTNALSTARFDAFCSKLFDFLNLLSFFCKYIEVRSGIPNFICGR